MLCFVLFCLVASWASVWKLKLKFALHFCPQTASAELRLTADFEEPLFVVASNGSNINHNNNIQETLLEGQKCLRKCFSLSVRPAQVCTKREFKVGAKLRI